MKQRKEPSCPYFSLEMIFFEAKGHQVWSLLQLSLSSLPISLHDADISWQQMGKNVCAWKTKSLQNKSGKESCRHSCRRGLDLSSCVMSLQKHTAASPLPLKFQQSSSTTFTMSPRLV